MNKELEQRDPEELLLMGGCPQCGLEVNEAFVKDVIDRIRTKAYELGKKEVNDNALVISRAKRGDLLLHVSDGKFHSTITTSRKILKYKDGLATMLKQMVDSVIHKRQ